MCPCWPLRIRNTIASIQVKMMFSVRETSVDVNETLLKWRHWTSFLFVWKSLPLFIEHFHPKHKIIRQVFHHIHKTRHTFSWVYLTVPLLATFNAKHAPDFDRRFHIFSGPFEKISSFYCPLVKLAQNSCMATHDSLRWTFEYNGCACSNFFLMAHFIRF